MTTVEQMRDRIIPSVTGLSTVAADMLGYQRAPDVQLRAALVEAGAWMVEPLAVLGPAFQPWWLGLLCRPGLSADQWPVVLVSDRNIVTISSSTQMACANILYTMRLRQSFGWPLLRRAWSAVEGEFLELERAMGGEGCVAALGRLVADPVNEREAKKSASKPALRGRFEARILGAFDPDPDRKRFCEYVLPLIERVGGGAVPPALGAWSRQGEVCAFLRGERSAPANTAALAGAWGLVCGIAALDTALAAPQLTSHPATGLADSVVHGAAELLMQHQEQLGAWRESPFWSPTVELATNGRLYSGHAHLQAANVLCDRDEPDAAWAALASAAFWSRVSMGRSTPMAFERARSLASSRGWADVVDVLDRNAATS